MRLTGLLLVILLLLIAGVVYAVNPAIWVWVLAATAVIVFVGMLVLLRGR